MEHSTTHEIPGKKTIKNHGIVVGYGSGDLKARDASLEKAHDGLIKGAKSEGANAIVGISYQFTISPQDPSHRNILIVNATGTAVTVK